MAAIRLGKNHLRWCDECNLPVLEMNSCPFCGKGTHEVEVTPPGEVRPAFEHDIDMIRGLVDTQFGEGCGYALIPEGQIVLLNKAPSLDRMDEVIIDGKTAATIRFDLAKGWIFLNRMQSAMRISKKMTKGYVVIDDAAIPFVKESKNLMAPGVIDASPEVKDGDEIVIVDKDRNAIATGTARMSAADMIASDHGMAVRTKWYKDEQLMFSDKKHTWDEVVKANEQVIIKRRNEAVEFIKKTIEQYDKPAIVSFSGGKDSLCTLLLTMDAGLKLPVLFVNTGLEFNETVEHVHDVCTRHDLQLIEETAPTDAFFGNLVQFGPPAKDYRWCCKTNKLGPTVGAINKNFPDGVLSFIGQRKYESEARHNKPRIWVNPWTPGQTGASPIQSWNSIHVWFYLFYKKEPFNVWYTRGLDRIGCFLCPASDLAEFDIVAGNSDRYPQWNEYLDKYMNERGLPEEWKKYGLWRWKRAPQSIKEEVQRVSGKDVSELTKQTKSPEKGPLNIKVQEGYSPCVIGYSIEAALSRPIDLDRLVGFMQPLGRTVEKDPEGQWASVDNITIYREGAIISKANVENDARQKIERLFELIIRSEQCVGCGLCAARCGMEALRIENGRVEMYPDECIRCGDCFGPCPALNFRNIDEDI